MAETGCSAILQTVAALGSTVAAFLALCVSYQSHSFQRNLLLKKEIIERIQFLLQEFRYLNTFECQDEHDPSDEAIEGLPKKMSEVKASVMALEVILAGPSRAEAKKIMDILDNLSVATIATTSGELDGAIGLLQNIHRMELT